MAAAIEPKSTPPDRLIVTIDGPAGTGKSSVAASLAERLGLELLDTGAMYRAATALALDHAVPLDNERAVADLAERASLRFAWNASPPMLTAFAADITHRLREADVTASVSVVAAHPAVRTAMVESQRRIGREHPRLLSEGRDQGSVVFPDADVKFYLDAEPRIRAERRAAQLREAGVRADVDAVEVQLRERDRLDASRAVSPLRCPDDAICVDTTSLEEDAVVDLLEHHVRAQLADPHRTEPSTPAH
ncbi:MAG: (d)CMP kinase [Planctomycetota bacterium]